VSGAKQSRIRCGPRVLRDGSKLSVCVCVCVCEGHTFNRTPDLGDSVVPWATYRGVRIVTGLEVPAPEAEPPTCAFIIIIL
jgi:hypothetical protein